MDEQIVQPAESVEATTEVSGETPPKEPTEPDKLSELEKKLRADFRKDLEEVNRHWQSTKDKEVKEARREAGKYRRAVEESNSLIESIRKDPVMKQRLGYYENQAMSSAYQQKLARETEEEAKQEYFNIINDSIEEMGIKKDDPRLDLGENATNIHEATKRVLGSIAKIQKEDFANAVDRITKETRAQIKDEIANIRKEEGLDSVDVTNPSNRSSGGGLSDVFSKTKTNADKRKALDEFIKGE